VKRNQPGDTLAADNIAKAALLTTSLIQSAVPTSVKTTVQLHDSFSVGTKLAERGAAGQLAELGRAISRPALDLGAAGQLAELGRAIRGPALALGAAGQLAELGRVIRGPDLMPKGLRTMMELTDRLAGGPHLASALGAARAGGFVDTLKPFHEASRRLEGLFPTSMHAALGQHFTQLVTPTMLLLNHDWLRPTAILAMHSSIDGLGSLAWRTDKSRTPAIATWLPDARAPRLPRIEIEVTTSCGLCGATLFVAGETMRWSGPRKLSIDLTIVPICESCERNESDSPDYYEQLESALNTLRLVRGSGDGDGKPQGRLRLVRSTEPPTQT